MPARILDGKVAAAALLQEIGPRVQALSPRLTIIQVGDDPASSRYIRAKIKACAEAGARADHKHLNAKSLFEDVAALIRTCNDDVDVDGILLQLPLPPALASRERELIRLIDPAKDVDGLTAYNIGKLCVGKEYEHLAPATPAGIIRLLAHFDIPVAGKHVVVVGRSTLVGKPLGLMLLHRDATVTFCHSKTSNLAEHTRQADILIAAAGSPGLIMKEMVKPGATVIDVGTSDVNGTLTGDVTDDVAEVAGALTPVPGGVGPMTVAMLIANLATAAERRRKG
jgi:methylenetetrahydrofolate dehydrogenase (NADP+)/methenyltetrahydrofolate cyclohydrolase